MSGTTDFETRRTDRIPLRLEEGHTAVRQTMTGQIDLAELVDNIQEQGREERGDKWWTPEWEKVEPRLVQTVEVLPPNCKVSLLTGGQAQKIGVRLPQPPTNLTPDGLERWLNLHRSPRTAVSCNIIDYAVQLLETRGFQVERIPW